MGTTEFTRELVRQHVEHELIPHRPTTTAREEALEVGLAEVGKTIVLHTPSGYVRAVLPATHRLDLHKVRLALREPETRLASETELATAYPMFELGAVPPFGGPADDRALVDRQLATRDTVVLEAGSHRRSVRLQTRDIVRLAEALIADICDD